LCVVLIYFNLFFGRFLYGNTEVKNQLHIKDKKQLEELFIYLTTTSPFAYTLLGNKPISWISINLPSLPEFKFPKAIIQRPVGNFPLWNKWITWTKYKQNFRFKNYLFIEEKSKNAINIFVINKKQFIKIVDIFTL
jgi:hypothetical protein